MVLRRSMVLINGASRPLRLLAALGRSRSTPTGLPGDVLVVTEPLCGSAMALARDSKRPILTA